MSYVVLVIKVDAPANSVHEKMLAEDRVIKKLPANVLDWLVWGNAYARIEEINVSGVNDIEDNVIDGGVL